MYQHPPPCLNYLSMIEYETTVVLSPSLSLIIPANLSQFFHHKNSKCYQHNAVYYREYINIQTSLEELGAATCKLVNFVDQSPSEVLRKSFRCPVQL